MASSEATKNAKADVYGQFHPAETKELILEKLEDFQAEINKLPDDVKKCLMEAEEKCPDLVTDDFKLIFLRSEVFNVDLAAKRYASYWDKRVEVFGPEKAFLPLTLDGALKDDDEALTIGYANFLAGHCDPMGRGIMYMEAGRQDKTKYSRASMVRAIWYMLHAAMEKEETQKYGMLFITYPGGVTMSQIDRGLIKILLPSIQGTIPIRLSAFHSCQPPTFLRLVLPFVKLFMSDRTKERLLFHFGSTEKVRDKLASYGLTAENIPQTLGGDVVVDTKAWIQKRRAEGK